MKFFIAIIIFLFSLGAYPSPQKIEMIFLSPQKVSQLLEIIDKQNNSEKIFTLLSQADQDLKNCVPMGDGCFDPQLGYIEKKPAKSMSSAPIVTTENSEFQFKTFNAIETSLVNCDKENYFDIYCGQEKAKRKPPEIEIWFDISSSLRTVDYSKDSNNCNRRFFMTKVMSGCNDKVKVSVYNTSLKEVGDFSSVCMAYGTNDEARLLRWMKETETKLLIIVTDIDEISLPMKNFLSERGARMIGDGVKPFSSTDLVEYANDIVKMCKK